MPTNRCFQALNKTINNAGELTKKYRQETIYKELQENARPNSDGGSESINPLKKNGSRYNDNFLAKGGSVGGIRKFKLAQAKNYELLLDVTKGKRFNNPLLNPSAAKAQMLAGQFLKVKYDLQNAPPIQAFIWTQITAGDRHPDMARSTSNRIVFPVGEPTYYDWNSGSAPGHIIDPKNKIFYAQCYHATTEQQLQTYPPWFKHTVSLTNTWTDYYWRAVNAQPLHNFQYPSTINLWFEDQKINKDSPSNEIDLEEVEYTPAELSAKYCSGSDKII
jgi:hypothetical protein